MRFYSQTDLWRTIMRVLVASYNPEELSRDTEFLKQCRYEVIVAQNFVRGLSAFSKDPTNPHASVDAAVVDIDIARWAGSSWPGLWLLNQVRRKQIRIPFLLHSTHSSYEESGNVKLDFTTLNSDSPIVAFQVRQQNRQYIGDFLKKIR